MIMYQLEMLIVSAFTQIGLKKNRKKCMTCISQFKNSQCAKMLKILNIVGKKVIQRQEQISKYGHKKKRICKQRVNAHHSKEFSKRTITMMLANVISTMCLEEYVCQQPMQSTQKLLLILGNTEEVVTKVEKSECLKELYLRQNIFSTMFLLRLERTKVFMLLLQILVQESDLDQDQSSMALVQFSSYQHQ